MKKQIKAKIYEDESIVALNKAPGMLSIPDRYGKNIPNLYDSLKSEYGDIFIVHRLDKDTSGLILFAKTAEAHKDISIQFEQRQVEKSYHAILSGRMKDAALDVDIPLLPNPAGKGGVIPSSRGKESHTKFIRQEIFSIATFVECRPLTGRQHQIRAHAAALGHPLLVDPIYGNQSEFYLSSIKRRYNLAKEVIEKPLISRLSLHSYGISFTKPGTTQSMSLIAAYPKDFEVTLKQLRKYAELPEYVKEHY